MSKIIIIVSIFSFFSMCVRSEDASIISLIASPQMYENKNVLVIGVVALSPEVSSIYLDEWSFSHGVNANSVKISFENASKYTEFDGVASIVYGTFKKNRVGNYYIQVENIGVSVPSQRSMGANSRN